MMSKKIVSGRSNIHKVNREKRPEFDEIAIYFSKEEWESLEEEQKALYKDVIMDNFRTLQSLGTINCKPPVVMKIEQGEEPYVTGYQHVNDNEHLIDTRKALKTELSYSSNRRQSGIAHDHSGTSTNLMYGPSTVPPRTPVGRTLPAQEASEPFCSTSTSQGVHYSPYQCSSGVKLANKTSSSLAPAAVRYRPFGKAGLQQRPETARILDTGILGSGSQIMSGQSVRRKRSIRGRGRAHELSRTKLGNQGRGPEPNDEDERQRGLRFTHKENEVLIRSILERAGELFSIRKMKGSASYKKALWKQVGAAVSNVGICKRSVEVCKKRYQDCKRIVRQKMLERELHSKGGGPRGDFRFNSWEEMLRRHLRHTTPAKEGTAWDTSTIQAPDLAVEESSDSAQPQSEAALSQASAQADLVYATPELPSPTTAILVSEPTQELKETSCWAATSKGPQFSPQKVFHGMVKTQEYNTPHPMTQEPIPSQYSFMNHGSNQSFRMMGITHRPETTYSAEPPPPPPQTPVRTLPAYSMASSATQSPIPTIIRVKLSPHMHFSPSFSSPGSDSTPQEEWSFSDVDPPREGEPTETEPGPSYTTPEDVKPFNQSYTESMSSCLHAMKQLNRARNKELFQLRESQAQFNETFNTWLTQIHEEVRQLKYNQMFHPRENQSNESSNTWLSQIHEEIRQLKYSQLDIGCHLMHKNTILNDLVHEIRNLNNNVMRVSEHLSTFAHITTSTLPDNTPIRSQHHSQTNQSGAPSNQS